MPALGHSWVIALLVLAIVLIVLGPGKLSQLGGALGKTVKAFRKAQTGADEPGDSGQAPK